MGVTAVLPISASGFAVDAGVPHRDLLLNAAVMSDELAGILQLPVEDCVRLRAKYRVGEGLRVTYGVQVGHEELQVALRCFPGRSQELFDKDAAATFHLRHLDTVGWVFPADRKLSSLRAFWSKASVRRKSLKRDVESVELVSFAPGKSATIRCDHDGETIGFTKLYQPGEHAQVVARYRSLAPALEAREIRIPAITVVDDQLSLMMVTPLTGHVMGSTGVPESWRKLGVLTANLHTVEPPISGLPPFDRGRMDRLRLAGDIIVKARPDVEADVRRLIITLARRAEALQDQPNVILHGDLHGKNVLLDPNDGVGLIDLDQAALGPAAAELGSLIAAMRVADSGDSTAMAANEAWFLTGYADRTELPPPDVVAWHIAAALIGERALRAVNRVRTDSLTRLPQIIRNAIETLERPYP